ncbi:MAG: ABC transporter permease [Candidatus Helarchaeota archaeon]
MVKLQTNAKNKIGRILNLILKELEALFRDKQALLIIFLLPILVIVAIGSTSNAIQGNSTIIIGVVDLDTSGGYPGQDLSVNFTQTLDHVVDDTGKEYVIVWNYTEAQYNASQPWHDLQEGKIDAYIVIPEGFETAITTISVVYVNLTTDATNIKGQANVIGAVVDAIADFKFKHDFYADEIIPVMYQEWFSSSSLFLTAAAVIGIAIFGSTLMTSSQSVVGDVPLKRVLLTPARKTEVLLAKLCAYLVIGFVQILILLFISWFIYGLPTRGSVSVLILLLFSLAFAGISLGLFISVISTSRLQASQYFLLAFIMMFILTYFVSSDFFGKILPLPLASAGFNDVCFKAYDVGALYNTFSIFLFGLVSLGLAFLAFYIRKHQL